MDIRNIQFELRQRRMDEVFDFALYVMRHNLWHYTSLLIGPVLLFGACNIAWSWYWYQLEEELLFWSGPHFSLIALLFLQKSLIAHLLILYNGMFLFNEKPSRRSVWLGFWRSLLRYGWHQIIVRMTWIFGLAWTLFFPARSLVTHFFKSEVILLEQLKGREMRERLRYLGRTHIERSIVFIAMELIFFIVWLLLGAFGYNQLVGLFDMQDFSWWTSANLEQGFLSPVVGLLCLPWFVFHSIAKFIYYIDARAEREGWAIEIQLLRGLQNDPLQGVDGASRI
ncbi:MAG: hypothetical protein KDK39_07060 [Leptospiraceae bacterium]|nr:hypothetical protein [Leptospiraceae bacterium]